MAQYESVKTFKLCEESKIMFLWQSINFLWFIYAVFIEILQFALLN